ncbi:sce7726 family protein [Leptospira yasudae]|uniref:sce7726 family protein n=1 Tax=Leptospira yasudae TaxID=2202201 RepID=UPI0010911D3A|nr:sce7726 family protein [Leptospira yasudae]TGM99676.1 hypothetical protein EHR10_08775 [Leptospira yasudae]
MKLNDKLIRKELKAYLLGKKVTRKYLVEELSVHNGNAIADVVSLKKVLHCYEIKGETDNLRRLQNQKVYYDTTFPFMTLVTTQNHLKSAYYEVPLHWGILEVKYTNNKVKFKNIRKASNNFNRSADKALLMLWKSELQNLYIQLFNKPPHSKLSRTGLIEEICLNSKIKKFDTILSKLISKRSSHRTS